MLKECLKLISNKTVKSTRDIANRLGIDEKYATELIDKLVQMEYLSRDNGEFSCGGKCFGCNLANCPSNSIITFSLTDKGKKYLKNL